MNIEQKCISILELENYIREQMYDIESKKAERIIARVIRKISEIKN